MGKSALQVGKRVVGRPKGTVSVSTHVPKPHTPFQWCAQDSMPETQRKQQMLRHEVRKVRGLELRTHDSETSILEGILARGDRRLADVIERAFHEGARMDSWEEHVKLDVWREALEHFAVDPAQFLGTIPVTAKLPWDHFDICSKKVSWRASTARRSAVVRAPRTAKWSDSSFTLRTSPTPTPSDGAWSATIAVSLATSRR